MTFVFDRAQLLRYLHAIPESLILVNLWDVVSAQWSRPRQAPRRSPPPAM